MRTSYDLETFVDFPPFCLPILERKLSGWWRDLVFFYLLPTSYLAVLDDSTCSASELASGRATVVSIDLFI